MSSQEFIFAEKTLYTVILYVPLASLGVYCIEQFLAMINFDEFVKNFPIN